MKWNNNRDLGFAIGIPTALKAFFIAKLLSNINIA